MDAELWNQTAETWLRSMENCVVPRLNPFAAVNVTLSELRLRVVEYPTNTRSKPSVDSSVSCMVSITGAREGMVNCRVEGEDGVRSTPAVVAKVGTSVTVSAIVPV